MSRQYLQSSHPHHPLIPFFFVLFLAFYLNSARKVGLGAQDLLALAADLLDPGVVVQVAGHLGAAESGSDLKGLCRRDAQHRVRQLGLQLVEAGLAQAGGHIADHTGHGAADRVVGLLCFDDTLLKFAPARDFSIGQKKKKIQA